MRKLAVCVCLLVFCKSALISQLAGNYWNLNYGTKAQLLNGAVIGGVDDNSALLYNPAAIGIDTVGGFSLSLFSPNYSIINTNSSQLNNLRISDFDLLPNMAVVDFPFFQNSKIKSSLGIFSKRSFSIGFANQFDVVDSRSQNFLGTSNYSDKVSEDYLGFGLSYNVSEEFQFGFTQGLTIRSENQFLLINGSVSNLTNSDGQRSFTSFNEFSTTFPSLNTKLGFLWRRKKYSIGLTVTTPPYFYLLDSGSYQIVQSQFSDGNFSNVLEETANGLGSNYKYPWSFGFGGVIKFDEGHKLYTSAEFFTGINPYTILQNPDSEIGYRLIDGSEQVTNASIGYENKVSDSFTLLCGLRTDLNSKSDVNINGSGDRGLFRFSWNIYHATAGGLFTVRNFRFSAGLGYAYSRSNEDIFNPFNPVFQSFEIDDFQSDTARSNFHSLTLFFNYSLLFKRLASTRS